MTPLHLGAVHAIEWALSLVLLVGPLVALGVVIVVARRHEEREVADAEDCGHGSVRGNAHHAGGA